MSAVDTGSEKLLAWMILVGGKGKCAWEEPTSRSRKIVAHEDTSIAPDSLPIIDSNMLLQEVARARRMHLAPTQDTSSPF